MKMSRITLAALSPVALAACATAPGPVEVTRFHDASTLSQLGQGTIFVESAPGEETSGLELATYKAAIASELGALGYTEAAREEAQQIAQISLERYAVREGGSRGPVSVGVGGSTGGYRSGVGLGVGINLGGGPKTLVGTELQVRIRDKASDAALWEGRAQFSVNEKSELANASANAQTVASALFREFPGSNGETVEVGVQ